MGNNSIENLIKYDTPAHEVGESIIKTVGTNKVIIWVEGYDWNLYKRFFNDKMVDCQGRKGGFSCHSAIDSYHDFKKKYPNNLAIVILDADFKRANGEKMDAEDDVFYTDCHDHEMMCIHQKDVRDALNKNFKALNNGKDYYSIIFEELKMLSYLKWYNSKFNRGYIFTKFNAYNLSNYSYKDIHKLEQTIYNSSTIEIKKKKRYHELQKIRPTDLDYFINNNKADYYELTNGHDYYARIKFYIKNAKSEDQLKDTIIYTAFAFDKTDLYTSIKAWCNTNVNILK